MAQYQALMGSVLQAGKSIGPGVLTGLRAVSSEFERQKTLAAFWGVSGFQQGVISLKSAFSSFLTTSGRGFTSWIQNGAAHLAQFRTALVVVSASMIAVAGAAALSSKHSQNYIKSTLDSGLMARKLTDKAGAEKWIEGAQGTDWSTGRDSRMGVFQTVLSKNPYIGQKGAQKATEDIEKFFFANQEMLKKKGIASAEDMASRISAPVLSGEDATIFEDIFGLGFANKTAQARLGRVSTEAKDIDIDKAVAMRPDEVLTKRLTATTTAMGDAVIPALNSVLGGFLKISDAIGKIPGLGKAMGWGAVLMGAASAGLIVVSMLGSLIPGLLSAYKAFQVVAAGVKLMTLAMASNPLGIAIIGIAALATGLYLLEQKFHIVTKAWKMFSESSIGKGILGYVDNAKKALGDLLSGKGTSGAIKIGMDILGAASPAFKILLMIADFIKRFWVNSNILNKLFASGLSIWQKMVDFFGWLINSVKAGVQWIKDGLGITKAEKQAEMEDIAKKEGIHWNENKGAWFSNTSGAQVNPSVRLTRAKEAYDEASPGIWGSIPGMDDLTAATKALTAQLTKPLQIATANINPGGVKAEQAASEVNTAAGIDYDIRSGFYVRSDTGQILSEDRNEALRMVGYKPSLAIGGQIQATGSIIGHGGEEVDPAQVVAGGKTTLAQINELFSRGSDIRSEQANQVSASVNVQVSIGKVDSDMDIDRLAHRIGTEGAEKLLFAIRNRINTAGGRDIGYMRG